MSTDWLTLLNEPSIQYQVKDSAVALIGDPLGSTSEANPVMALTVEHIESSLEFNFLFNLNSETVATFAAVFTQMMHDIANNGFLDTSVYEIEDEGDDED
jgi:hypothetical protein